MEEKNDDESDLGVKTEWALGSSQPGLRSPAGHILVESWGTFPKCMCVCTLSCNELCDPWTVARQAPLSKEFSRICKNTGTGCHFLLQGIFLTQGSNPCLLHLLHWQVDSSPLAPPAKPQFYIYQILNSINNLKTSCWKLKFRSREQRESLCCKKTCNNNRETPNVPHKGQLKNMLHSIVCHDYPESLPKWTIHCFKAISLLAISF